MESLFLLYLPYMNILKGKNIDEVDADAAEYLAYDIKKSLKEILQSVRVDVDKERSRITIAFHYERRGAKERAAAKKMYLALIDLIRFQHTDVKTSYDLVNEFADGVLVILLEYELK